MTKYEEGTRVFAVLSADQNEVKLLGHGEYIGDRLLKEEANQNVRGPFGIPIRSIVEMDPEHKNPCIKLDDGKIVWGFECWWGPETRFNEMVKGRAIINVDIDEARKS